MLSHPASVGEGKIETEQQGVLAGILCAALWELSSEWKHLAINSACCHCQQGLQGQHTTLEQRPHRRNRDDSVHVRKDLDNFSI